MRLDEVVDLIQSRRLELITIDKELRDNIDLWLSDYTEDFCSALGLERMAFKSKSFPSVYELLKNNRSKLKKLKRKIENCLLFNEAIIYALLRYEDYPHKGSLQANELKLFFALLLWVGIAPDSIFDLLSDHSGDRQVYASLIADFGVINRKRAEYLLPLAATLDAKQRKLIIAKYEKNDSWQFVALVALCRHFNKK